MPGEENLYQQLLDKSYSKQAIHNVFHQFMLQEIACKKAYQQLSFSGKIKWHCKKYLGQATGFLIHLTAKGLILLKTQFAKKPKNPV